MLQVEHIAKTFGERQVLEDVNLQVNQGDVVVILGDHQVRGKRPFSVVSIT